MFAITSVFGHFVLAEQPPPDYHRLIWPGIVFVASMILFSISSWKWTGWIDSYLAVSRRRRILASVAVAACPFMAGVFFDIADVSKVVFGQMDDSDPWLLSIAIVLTLLFAFGQYILWHHDDRWNEREDLQKTTAEEAKNRFLFIDFVNNSFLGVVALKSSRLRRNTDTPSVNGCVFSNFPKPDENILTLIMCVHDIFRRELELLNPHCKLRVCVFWGQNGYLTPAFSWDGQNEKCIRSPTSEHRSRFKMDTCANTCLAVSVKHSGRIAVIEDAEDADKRNDVPFFYFIPTQANQIRSIFVAPLPKDHPEDPELFLSVDTDCKRFFRADREELYETVAKNLSRRLRFEMSVQQLPGCPIGTQS